MKVVWLSVVEYKIKHFVSSQSFSLGFIIIEELIQARIVLAIDVGCIPAAMLFVSHYNSNVSPRARVHVHLEAIAKQRSLGKDV